MDHLIFDVVSWGLVLYVAGVLCGIAFRAIVRAGRTQSSIRARHASATRSSSGSNVSQKRSSTAPDVIKGLFAPGYPKAAEPKFIGFFHPYCNAGGGGERVLWVAVNAVLAKYPNAHAVVYTGDIDATPEQILATARERFGTHVDAARVDFVFLRHRWLVEAAHYPHFTLAGQMLGSILLGVYFRTKSFACINMVLAILNAWSLAVEAVCRFIPDTMIDTMGYAFVFPVFSVLAHARIACYVHYPTISTDMLTKTVFCLIIVKVQKGQAGFNNARYIANSATLTTGKLLYYRVFAFVYGIVGRFSEVVLVNSSWTKNHINSLWAVADRTQVVFPPCDTATFEKLPLQPRDDVIVSLSQFRPEKNHALQIRALATFFSKHPQYKGKVKLIMVGGCRNADDQARVLQLQQLTAELGLKASDVDIQVNLPFGELTKLLSRALVGIHTMKEEHFGIGVVEFMAAGNLTLAANSGGPKSDIVVAFNGQQTGWLAESADEYADALAEIFALSADQRSKIQLAARHSVSHRFSEEAFSEQFLRLMDPVL